MKKLLIILSIVFLSASVVNATENVQANIDKNFKQPQKIVRHHQNNAFEERLKLTDEQKIKIKEQRTKSFEKIKPIMNQIKQKKKEVAEIKNSDMANDVKEEKLNKLDSEIKDLSKQARSIRKQNMKDFESILTKEQKETLKTMKKNGRNNYYKKHPRKCNKVK